MIQGRKKTKWILVSTVCLISSISLIGLVYNFSFSASHGEKLVHQDQKIFKKQTTARNAISHALQRSISKSEFPDEINIQDLGLGFIDQKYLVNYSFEKALQIKAYNLLQQYKPDYGAIVVLDATSGRVLAMSSYTKKGSQDNLTLKATFPAASVFKVITASTAIDKKGVEPQHQIAFNGGNYTLYKKNVLSEKITKWTRFITLKDAFARSINTAFGRLTLENMEPKDLSEYAQKFMFNKYIPADFIIEQSQASIPQEKGYELTQVASGYNRFNTMSPVHGAMIAGTIINNGVMVAPYIVQELKNGSQTVYSAEPYELGQIISAESAHKMQSLMEQTVLAGTSRKTFRKLVKDKKFQEVEMGGKTGHFSGTNPKGTNDWFVGYGTDGERKIAVAAITVNVEKWTVKSSALAEMLLREYFKNTLEEKQVQSQLKNPIRRKSGNDQSLLVDPKSGKTSGS